MHAATTILVFAVACAACARGFVVSPVPKTVALVAGRPAQGVPGVVVAPRTSTSLRSSNKEEAGDQEQEVKDLTLEDMFDVFEAADEAIKDEEVGKKPEPEKKEPSSSKGSDNPMGDILSNFFGGKRL